MTPRSLASFLFAATIAAAAWAQPAPSKGDAPKPGPRPAAPATPADAAPDKAKDDKAKAETEYKTAEELLEALETADKKIKTITAELYFTTVTGEIEGRDMQRRHGRIYFRNQSDAKTADGKPAPDAHAAAAVRFDDLEIVKTRKRFDEQKTYVVNGNVVIERIDKEKLVNRYKIGAGDQDPLKLGQGPFPLPFGQKKDEVLERFNAELVPALQGLGEIHATLKQRLSPTYQLRLIPKSEAGISKNVKEVRVWYQKKDLMPVLARIIRPDDGFDEFFLVGTQLNKPLPENVFDTSVPPGWKVEEKERP